MRIEVGEWKGVNERGYMWGLGNWKAGNKEKNVSSVSSL